MKYRVAGLIACFGCLLCSCARVATVDENIVPIEQQIEYQLYDEDSEVTGDDGAPKVGDKYPAEEHDVNIENDTQGVIEIDEVQTPLGHSMILMPSASGIAQEKNNDAVIDYSNVSYGYVMVAYSGTNATRVKSQVKCPDGVVYTYDVPVGYWVAFPLTHGNGTYTTTVLKNTGGNKYATLLSSSFNVTLENEFAPFIRPNQYVDYVNATNTVSAASQIVAGSSTTLEKVNAVYDWVVGNLTYDYNLAANVQSGYLPVLDNVLAKRKGICFDYAALMTGMLRSQLIPCKLVVGYAGTSYHAWISVYTAETGWIDNAIYFDGTSWHRMDPTFASTGGNNEEINKYIGNGKNYVEKYSY